MERWPKIKMWKYILRKKMLYGIGFVCVLIGMTVTGVCIKPAKEVQASISHEAVKDIRSDAPGGGEDVSEQPEGENTDDWKKPEELGIKVIGLDKVNSVTTTLVLKELNVPTRDEGKREFDIIVPDTDSYDYRILATNCPDCWNLFKEIKQGEILDSDDKRGRIVVGSGTIN